MDLFEDDREPRASSSKAEFGVNTIFASAYDARKRAEELSNLKEKYGDAYGSEDSESTDYSSEDSDGELATPAIDAAIFHTLDRIRRRDQEIYDPSRKVFFEEERRGPTSNARKRAKSDKAVTLNDYQRHQLLGGGGPLDEDVAKSVLRTPAQERDDLRDEVTKAFHDAVEGSDGTETLLVRRTFADDEVTQEENAYRTFLLDSGVSTEEGINEEAGDKFLRDYILNRGWMDRSKSGRIPTHADIVNVDIDDEADADFEERAEEFEHRYNFRFEEPGSAQIQSHPRSVATSVRRTDDGRKAKRAERRRLKTLRGEAELEKLARVRDVVGQRVEGLDDLDLDEDFDPDDHDRVMAKIFSQTFYADDVDSSQKPEWAEDIDIRDLEPNQDLEAVTNAPFDDSYDPTETVTSETMKNKSRRHNQDAYDSSDKQTASGKHKLKHKLAEYLRDDVPYAELIGGNIPTRFHYTHVARETYGLSPAEILLATDSELNAVAGLARLAPYRPYGDSGKPHKSSLRELKTRLRQRRWGDAERGYDPHAAPPRPSAARPIHAGDRTDHKPKQRMGRKRREKLKRKGIGEET